MQTPSTNPHPSKRFVACGMYAFTEDLKTAWQTLFNHFLQRFETPFSIEPELRYETGEVLIRAPNLLIGQTCGYPLMSNLRETVTPVCVPVFDIAGCDGKRYSSVLVVPEHSEIESLTHCRQRIATINTIDSNSGMNVLRHAIAPLSQGKPYFSEIRNTGSHLQSLTEVAAGKAQVAAIDAVSFCLIQDAWPDLVARVRSIGYTTKTCGLPFVIPHTVASQLDMSDITDCFNDATLKLPEPTRRRLHLRGFERTDIDEYHDVLELEQQAQQAGYSQLS